MRPMGVVSSETYLRYCGQAGKRQALDWCYIVDFRFFTAYVVKRH